MNKEIKKNKISILIAALGGEGGGVLMNWIVKSARKYKCSVQATSVPGVAQRTGATSYYIELSQNNLKKTEKTNFSLIPMAGRVDLVIASELLEAARMMEKGFVSDKTTLITSNSRIYTNFEKMHKSDGRYNSDTILNAAEKLSQTVIALDLHGIATKYNTIVSAPMFGALSASNILPWSLKHSEKIISSEQNSRNNILGFSSAAKLVLSQENKRIDEKIFSDEPKESIDSHLLFDGVLPDKISLYANLGYNRCKEFQNKSYANLYILRVNFFLKYLNKKDFASIKSVSESIRVLALWMTYEDIPRVASIKKSKLRVKSVEEELKLLPGQTYKIYDYFRPSAKEIRAILPSFLGKFVEKSSYILAKITYKNNGIKVVSNSITGFIILSMLSSLRYIRKYSSRYEEEQNAIDAWMNLMGKSFSSSSKYSELLASLPSLLKGYGDTWDVGKKRYKLLLKHVVYPTIDRRIEKDDIKLLSDSLNAALNFQEDEKLNALLKK